MKVGAHLNSLFFYSKACEDVHVFSMLSNILTRLHYYRDTSFLQNFVVPCNTLRHNTTLGHLRPMTWTRYF